MGKKLDARSIHLYRNGLLKQLGRQNQPTGALPARENAFDAGEGARLDSDPVALVHKRMGLDPETALDGPLNRINFRIGNKGRAAGNRHDGTDSRRGKNLYASLGTASQEHIARKQRKGKMLFSVLPLPDNVVEGQKGLKAVSREMLDDGFLVLVAGVDRPPFSEYAAVPF
jgi:hypothetical protein